MLGGGAHGVGQGQITDDGELTMCLLHALCEGKGKIVSKQIARFYAKWIKSRPFDIGNTWRAALFKADIKNPNAKVIKKAAMKSDHSQSNGSLMRITPMAVFWHKFYHEGVEEEDKELKEKYKQFIFEAAIEDGSFTHWN